MPEMGETMTKVVLFGKAGCKLCAAAIEKLDLLGVAYEKRDIEPLLAVHEGWREDESCEVFAAYEMAQHALPIIRVGRDYLSYPEAMKRLKEKKP